MRNYAILTQIYNPLSLSGIKDHGGNKIM